MEFLFWFLIAIVFYSYIGYGIVLIMLVKLRGSKIDKRIFESPKDLDITHIIAAYNEEDYIEDKIQNCLSLEYPYGKCHTWFVTDGSDDQTPEIIAKNPDVKLFHRPERMGKIHAVNRVMPEVSTPIVVYSDANTELNTDAMMKLVRHYQDETVGCVSGEKRIKQETTDEAASSGEGIYWKYESLLKRYDYMLYSVVGAAGELFSIRTDLYEPMNTDTLIEDFYLSLSIAKKGYRIAYEPEAYAMEKSSDSVKEESKRKVRIAAGGHQAIWRLRGLLNIFKYGILTFQYVSHRVLRWTLAPLALPIIFGLNIYLALHSDFYRGLLVLQCLFYFFSLLGYYFQSRKIKIKAFFVPFYFTFMNWSVYRGFLRYIKGSQSVLWERAARKK